MKPAASDVIDTVVHLLLKSLDGENPSRLANSLEASCLPSDRIADEIDDYVTAFKSTLASVQSRLLEKISRQYSQRNTLAPLHQLSLELFVTVLDIAVLREWRPRYPDKEVTNLRRIISLRLVCKLWMTVIDSAASLWGTFDSLDPAAMRKVAPPRSAGSPLDVNVVPPTRSVRYASAAQNARKALFKEVIRHIERWRSASVALQTKGELLSLTHRAAPSLETVEIKCMKCCVQTAGEAEMFPGKRRPPIRNLLLSGVAMPWSSGLFKGLENLSISEVDDFLPSSEEICGILEGCPTLFTVNFCCPKATAGKSADGLPTIVMACLREMSMTIRPQCAAWICARLRAPQIRKFKLSLDFTVDSFPVSPIFKETNHILLSTLTRDAETQRRRDAYTGYAAHSYPLDRPDTRSLVVEMSEELIHSRIEATSIALELDCQRNLETRWLLQHLSDIGRVTRIGALACQVDPLLRFLSKLDDGHTWGFLHLEKLQLYDCDYMPYLLFKLVENRFQKAQIDEEDVDYDFEAWAPAPFKLLLHHAAGDLGEDVEEALEEMIGKENFEVCLDVVR